MEIYNNTMLNADWQTLLIKLVYFKLAITVLLIHITTFSLMRLQQVLLYGKGNCTFTNNYLSSNMGMFMDNRVFSDSLTNKILKKLF
jgi:hypothetical protein